MNAPPHQKPSPLPPFMMNSIPKSGTHLLKQALQGMPGIVHRPVNEFYIGPDGFDAPNRNKLYALPPNQFAAGHLYYSAQAASLMRQRSVKQIFIIRDLRDVVVSFAYFIIGKYPYHPLRDYMLRLPTMKRRYMTLIYGMPSLPVPYPNLAQWIEPFLGWLSDGNTLVVTYEQMMATPQSRRATLLRIIGYLWNGLNPPAPYAQMAAAMEQAIDPSAAYTFRSGRIGDWRQEMDADTRNAFKLVAGHVLIRLGYESNNLW